MVNPYFIGRIAFYEARLLLRSWGFRLFAGLVLGIVVLVNIAIATPAFYTPYFMRSLSGSLPLSSLKLFNVFQGIIVAFMATEFFKRDRRHDSIQVVFARSFTNVEYYLGKALGIFSVFLLLNLVVLLSTIALHVIFSTTPFVLHPYLLYTMLICLPTLILMIGLSFFLSSLLKSQVVVFLVLLAYSFLVLVFLGTPFFGLFDSYAFYLPLMWSDFIGLGNVQSALLIRFSHVSLGLSFIFISPLLFKRLRQSALSNIVAGSLSALLLTMALIFGFSATGGFFDDREFRQQLKATSQKIVEMPEMTILDYVIEVEHQEKTISVSVDMEMTNESKASLDVFWLTLNPGLEVQSVTGDNQTFDFTQDQQLIRITSPSPVESGDLVNLSIDYSGYIDERYCFLDIDRERFESRFRLWLYDIPKHYALVTSDYVHLTPESGWYPIAGLSTGKAFPAPAAPQYSTYTLSVLCPEGLTPISQGVHEKESLNGQTWHTFTSETKLPQISLTIGVYEQKNIKVDNTLFSLYVRPGHDYFTPFLDEIGENLPSIIREQKDEYELVLGLDYPYKRLSLVEVPIHIYSYQRLWTVAYETVQPEIVFLPEMGTYCTGADFEGQARNWERWGKFKKGGAVSAAEVQSYFLTQFIRSNLLNEGSEQLGYIKGEGFAITFQADIEPQFEVFPNFVSYSTYVSSAQWPVLNVAFESYIRERFSPPRIMGNRNGLGLSRKEAINLELKEHSLSDLLESPSIEAAIVNDALQAKGKMLLTLLEAQSADTEFNFWMTDFLEQNRFSPISQQDLIDFLFSYFELNLPEIINPWYSGSQIPGYIIGDVESYEVMDRERTWTQINFKIANPTRVDGAVKIDVRYRSNKNAKVPEQGRSDYTKSLFIPAETTIDVGLPLDMSPALMTIDTFVSQNIPAIISVPFFGNSPQREGNPFDSEMATPFDPSDFINSNETIVDNSDEGFQILGTAKEGWLSQTLKNLRGRSEKVSPFAPMNVVNPPSFWTLSAGQQFYGQIIRSAYLKKAGNGDSAVVWNVDLEDGGSYDIFFYNGIPRGVLKEIEMLIAGNKTGTFRSRAVARGRFKRGPGKRTFKISHQYGTDEVQIDLLNAEQGWNFIGSFQLDAGPNTVEQTDKNNTHYVTADAIKWVKR